MSVALMAAVQDFKPKHKPNEEVQLRIGVHSGTAIAGVVGLRMPKYCMYVSLTPTS